MTLEDALIDVLKSTADLFLKTWLCHWNVTGPTAASLHELFGEQYAELYAATDTIAEQVRTLGEKVPVGFTNGPASMGDLVISAKWDAMVRALLADHTAIIEPINVAIELAEKMGDQGTLNLLADRAQAHGHAVFLLRMLIE